MKWLNKFITFNVLTGTLVISTLLVRFLAIHMYDLHIDELIYAYYSRAFASGYLPLSFETFFLHPPGYYTLLAIWRIIFWHGQDLFTQLTVLRGLNVVLSGFTVLMIILLTKLVTKKTNLAMAAGALFALDPIAIRINTRGLMETSAMLFLLVGLWLFLHNLNNPPVGRKTWLLTGLLFGLAIITKDVGAIFLVITFVILLLFRVGPQVKTFRYLIPTIFLPYAIWISILTFGGHLGQFISHKTIGIQRFFGLIQITGYNSSSSPSRSDTLLSTLPHYGSSYIVIGLGTLGILLLLFSKDKDVRIWGCIAAASVAVIGYLFVGGTFEEHYLYYLLAPSFITLIVAARELQMFIPSAYRYLVNMIYRVGIAILLLFGVITYVINMSTPDNGWQKTIEWVYANVAPKSTICTFAQGEYILKGEFFLNEHPFNICSWHSLSDINAHHVQYIIVPEKLIQGNYLALTAKDIADLKPESKVVFDYTSRDSGRFLILQIMTR